MFFTKKNILIAIAIFLMIVFVPIVRSSSMVINGTTIDHIDWLHDWLISIYGFKTVHYMRYSFWEPCALLQRGCVGIFAVVIYLAYAHNKNKSSW